MKILKLTLWGMLFLCFNSTLFAHFEVEVLQEVIDDECQGNISITVHGNAGPFDIYLYSSATASEPLEEHLNIESGTIDFETIIANVNYKKSPVIKVYDQLGCEWVYDEIVLNCDCELVKIDTYEFNNGTYIEELPVHLHINKPSTCVSSDGSIKIIKGPMSNATYPLTFEWSDPSIIIGTQYHTNISPGIHTLKMTDANGCSDEIDIQFLADNGPDIWYSEVCPTCEGQTSGQITIHAATGGGYNDDGSYSDIELIWDFEIDDESTVEDDNENNPNIGLSTVRNLGPGEYCITIREHFISPEGENMGSCDNIQCFTIESLEPTSELNIHPAATLSTITNSCPNQATGSIFMAVSGGIKFNEVDCGRSGFDYRFEWSDGVTTTDYYRGPGSKPLEGGTYAVTVEDYCGVMDILEFEIPEFEDINIAISSTIGCPCKGLLELNNISGGEGNLIFVNVTGPDTDESFTIDKASGDNDRSFLLCDGEYVIRAEDEQGCVKEYAPVTVLNHPEMTLEVAILNEPCVLNTNAVEPYFEQGYTHQVGRIDLKVIWEGPNSYNATYEWSNGETTQDLTDIGYEDFPEGTNSKVYSVTVTDEFGCKKAASVTLTNKMKAEKLPVSNDNSDEICDCGFRLLCDGIEVLREEVQSFRKCDVLSKFTNNDEDCDKFRCFCIYPSQYNNVKPEGNTYSQFPLDCDVETERQKTVQCSDQPCSHDVICPNWDDLVAESPYSDYSFNDDYSCDITVDFNSNSDNYLVNSPFGCGNEVVLDITVFEAIPNNYPYCGIDVTATVMLNGEVFLTNYELPVVQFAGTTQIILDQFSPLVPDPNLPYTGIEDCNSILRIDLNLNNGAALASITLDHHYNNCDGFNITSVEDGSDCGEYIFSFEVPCLNVDLSGVFANGDVGCSASNFNANTVVLEQNVTAFNWAVAGNPQPNNNNPQISAQTAIFQYNGLYDCEFIEAHNLCDDNRCEIADSLCTTPFAPDGCETDLAAANNNDYQFITFSNLVQGATPAVISSPLSFNGQEPATVRLKNISNEGFEMKVHEWDYLDGSHSEEQISFLYGVPGIYDFGGLKAEIGFLNDVNHQFKTFELNANFDEAPVIITTLVTDNDSKPVARRVRNITANTFQLKLQEEPGNNPSYQHGLERVAYIAIEKGQGTINGKTVVVGNTGKTVNHNWKTISTPGFFSSTPLIFTEMQSTYGGDLAVVRYNNLTEGSFMVKVEEEQSSDTEVLHATEDVGYILIASDKHCKCDDIEITLLDSQVYNATCGQNNGSIDVQPAGGLPAYSFEWSNGDNTSSIDNLEEGDYTLTVTDANGCTAVGEFYVEGLSGLEMKYISHGHPSCITDDGWVQIYPLGGEEPYAYVWSNGETTQIIENLGPGTFTVTVTDNNGCTGQAEVHLSYLDLYEGYVKNDPVCGLDNGTIVGDAYGGAAPYTYLWDDGSTSGERDLLSPGAYYLTVTDSDGCTATRLFNLYNDNEINISASGGDEGFHDGKFIEGGVDLNWYFRPMTVADQLIIESSTDGVLLNTGAVTTRSYCGCDGDAKCDCADVFLGDHADQTISLLVGSGLVDPPSSTNCSGNNTPRSASGIGGTITIPSDGYITVTVVGNSCGSGYTNWYVTLTCESIVRSSRNEADYPIKDDVVNAVEEMKGIVVYPNPTSNFINLEIQDHYDKAFYSIFSVDGKQVETITEIRGSMNEIDLSELSSGLYILKVIVDGNSHIKKIIKQ